jgi:hypothetical protein
LHKKLLINLLTATKTTDSDDQLNQKDYKIRLLTEETNNLKARLCEANNLILEKDKQFDLLKKELDGVRKQLENNFFENNMFESQSESSC